MGIKQKLLYLYYRILLLKDIKSYRFLKNLKIFNSNETVKYIINNKCSVSRYGDGEFYVVGGKGNPFQDYDKNLQNKLTYILQNPISNHLICIPYSYTCLSNYNFSSKLFAVGYLANNIKNSIIPYINTNYQYGDSLFTRFYMPIKNKKRTNIYIKLLKKIWEHQNILIIEGEKSKLGVGNDLFNNVISISRILCPNKNAFTKYNDILSISEQYGKNRLCLIALGMTATALAYDLAKKNIWAIDIGHVDIEYEWFLIGASKKCAIKNKKVDEVEEKDEDDNIYDEKYNSEIICKIA